MEQEQTIEVVDAPVTVEETVTVTTSGGVLIEPATIVHGHQASGSPRLLQPLHPLRKVGRWPAGYGTTYVEAVGTPSGERDDDHHHYVEDYSPDSNHHPPPVAENIVVTSDDMMGEIISVTEDVVEEEVKTSHSPHHHTLVTSSGHHLEPNLPPGSLVKVEVVVEDGMDLKSPGGTTYLKASDVEPAWPEAPEPSPPSALSLPSTSTVLLPVDGNLHRLLTSSAPTTTTFVYARPTNHHHQPMTAAERIDETVNEVILSVTGRDYGVHRHNSHGLSSGPQHVVAGLPSFPSILTGSQPLPNPPIETLNVMGEVLQPPPPMPSQIARPHPGPVTIVKTRRPRSQLTDEDRRFRCSYCDKAFTARSSLDVHERIHTGERPYKCTECGKTFRHCGHLTCHLRTHTGERPYVCRVCGKGFTQSTPCRRHEQTQHNLSP